MTQNISDNFHDVIEINDGLFTVQGLKIPGGNNIILDSYKLLKHLCEQQLFIV